MKTRREQIVEVLMDEPASLTALARKLLVAESVVRKELEHVRRSLAAKGLELQVSKPVCPRCGEVKLRRITNLSKCPRCKGWIEKPKYRIVAKD
ncbi:MAG: hypothetical protein DRO11_00945 [Methanobacteriota archaeon]|nr:MAG: hypothetical protein DRO11_00945 [Euryarchaeota archaeon]